MINEYAGIDWNRVLTNAEKHPEQTESTAIGVGTDGRSVNMDLWVYSLLEDGTYGLNTKENINTDTSQGVTSGYKGSFTEDGQIEGTIPQYISEDNGETYKEVTDLKWLFFNCSEMKIAPKIPTTVKKMNFTFRRCIALKDAPEIPNSVEEMGRTFQECENLENVPNISNNTIDLSYTFDACKKMKKSPIIPDSVKIMDRTFKNCTSLEVVPKLYRNLINMYETFIYCNNLKTIGSPIPETVTNMNRTFYQCENLTGTIEINANLNGNIIFDNETDYGYMFLYAVTNENCKVTLTGNCKMLSRIVEQSNNPNIVLGTTAL